MAASTNFMIFVPTAVDTFIQAQALNTATAPANNAPNLGLNALLANNPNITRTGATVNSVAGFAYQGDMGQIGPLIDYLRQIYEAR